MGRRIFITVAEVSGDKHAAQLIRSLRELDPQLTIEGHGGPEMAEAGARIHRNTVEKAAMGCGPSIFSSFSVGRGATSMNTNRIC